MKTLRKLTVTTLALFALALPQVQASDKTAMPGDIVAVASGAGSFNTLVAAVKAAGLVETLQGAGPFTVFAPTNAAFGMLPAGTVETLVKPENKTKLTGILTYHVVAGRLGAKDIDAKIKAGNGTAELATVAGGKLWISKKAGKYWIKDENGGM